MFSPSNTRECKRRIGQNKAALYFKEVSFGIIYMISGKTHQSSKDSFRAIRSLFCRLAEKTELSGGPLTRHTFRKHT